MTHDFPKIRPVPRERHDVCPVDAESHSMAQVSVQWLRTQEQIFSWQPRWLAFQQTQPPGASFYNDPRRILALVHEGRQLDPMIGLVCDREEVIAVIPLTLESKRFGYQLGPWRSAHRTGTVLRGVGDDWVFSRHYSPQGILNAVVSSLRQQPGFDAIYLRNVDVDGPLWRFFHSSGYRQFGWRAECPQVDVEQSHLIDVSPNFSTYEQRLSRNSRQQLRKLRRRLFREHAQVALTEVTTADQVPQFLNAVNHVYRETWQAATHAEIKPRNQPHQIARFEWIANQGWLRSFYLTVDHQPWAFLIGFQYAETYEADEAGYLPVHEEWSPGRVLWHCLLERLHQESAPSLIRFGWGDYPYKRALSTKTIDAVELFCGPNSSLLASVRRLRQINWLKRRVLVPLDQRWQLRQRWRALRRKPG